MSVPVHVALPSGVVTVTEPPANPFGTHACSFLSWLTLNLAGMPPIVTDVVLRKCEPLMTRRSPGHAACGMTLSITGWPAYRAPALLAGIALFPTALIACVTCFEA